MPKGPSTTLAIYTSKRTGEKYEIRRGADAVLYCTCKAFSPKFAKACKHLTHWKATGGTQVNLPVLKVPIASGLAAAAQQVELRSAKMEGKALPCWGSAQRLFDAMLASVAINHRPSIGALVKATMVAELARGLEEFVPPAVPVVVPVPDMAAVGGIRMIDFED